MAIEKGVNKRKTRTITFGSPKTSKNKAQENPALIQVRERLIEIVRILRTLEDRYNNLGRKAQLTDQNMIHEHKKLNKELKLVDSDLIETKKELNDLAYKYDMILKELELRAMKKDVDLVKRYIELWQPISFIRKKDAEKLIDNLIKNKIKKKEKVL